MCPEYFPFPKIANPEALTSHLGKKLVKFVECRLPRFGNSLPVKLSNASFRWTQRSRKMLFYWNLPISVKYLQQNWYYLCIFYHELIAIPFPFALTDDFPSPPKVCIAFDMLYATCTCFKLINSRYNQFIKYLCGEYKYPCHNIISHVHLT